MEGHEAQEYLGLGSSYSMAELEKAYRSKALLVHPDQGGSSEEFRQLQIAFKILERFVVTGAGPEMIGGRPVSELGKGYPLTESAKTCEECSGRGYQSRRAQDMQRCPECSGSGEIRVRKSKCRKCGGSGKHLNRTGKVAGVCWNCTGSGVYQRPLRWPEPCKSCGGIGLRMQESTKQVHYICYACKGIGEIKMWNPVIPRGFLNGARK